MVIMKFDEGYIPDFSSDTKDSLESEYYVTIADKSQSTRYIVVKKKIDRTVSLSDLNLLFEHDLRDCINRYADSQSIQLYCYHENICLTSELYNVEILSHTADLCNPEKLLEKIGQSVPQGTDHLESDLEYSGICDQCGTLIDPDQDYCLDCFDLLDHNVITADLREQKRLLEVAAYHATKDCVSENVLNSIAKALELNLQLSADLQQNSNKMGGCGMQPEEGSPVTTDPSSEISNYLAMEEELIEPSVVCSWCNKMLKETASMLVSHSCCDDCSKRLSDEFNATSEAI